LDVPDTLAIIAGNGDYPFSMTRAARRAGVRRVVAAAFVNETRNELADVVDEIEWMRVGQLGRLLSFLKKSGTRHAVMSGQIHPKNLFDLRPDVKALLLLGRLRARNAESIFGAIANEIHAAGIELLPATTYMDDELAPRGLIAGPALSRRETNDVAVGFAIAKETSRLDIGQTIIVKGGTVLAVEAFEGTNAAIKRGGELGRKDAVMIKVAKPGQDFRFDVPVIGRLTLETASAARLRVIAVEAGKTLLLNRDELRGHAEAAHLSLVGVPL
jgi:DUF1009 family protein